MPELLLEEPPIDVAQQAAFTAPVEGDQDPGQPRVDSPIEPEITPVIEVDQSTLPPTEQLEEPDENKQAYVEQALINLKNTSRTASGVIDTTASATKADAMVGGMDSAEIADTAVKNFEETVGQLYDLKDSPVESPEDLKGLVEAVAKQINGGLLKEGQLIRSGADSDKYPYTRLADLEPALEEFYDSFFDKLQDPDTDPIDLAAWVEYRIDLADHFFADGCGKTAKAVSAWVLMRADQPLPTYRGRDELYVHAPTTIRAQDPAKAAQEERAWQAYYKTLF